MSRAAPETGSRLFVISFCTYALASLVHFAHNAEYLAEYPNLPSSWTTEGVYAAWFALTAVGLGGFWLVARGFRAPGLALCALYAVLGLDSFGHYVVAPLSAHTLAMNATILLEVTAAGLLLVVTIQRVVKEVLRSRAR